jgi:hypothetical protein
MSASQKTQFSRMSLNVLMLVSVVLIVILYQPASKYDNEPLPAAPVLNAKIWLSDSGSQVWFHPMLSNTIEIQLWFKAGFRHDGQYKGRAYLLAQLLKYEGKQRKLPLDVSLDQDFIKVALHLSKSPLNLKHQIDQAAALLQHPALSHKRLKTLRTANASVSQDLRLKAYGKHPYAGPRQGTIQSLNRISRADLQKYHHQYLHPKRLMASIVGDLNEHSASIIMETLLPTSLQNAALDLPLSPHASSFAHHNEMAILVKPGLNNLHSQEQHLQLVKDYLLMQVLHTQQPSQSKWITGISNNTLYLQQLAQFRQNMRENPDWDMILRAKRQLASRWLQHVQGAPALSRYLVHLNAYKLPVNHMNQNLKHLQSITMDAWRQHYQVQLSEISR